jgi:hypothetical protein
LNDKRISHSIFYRAKGEKMTYDDEQAWKDAEAMGMTIYYIYLLRKGPAWSPADTPEINALQEAHLAN